MRKAQRGRWKKIYWLHIISIFTILNACLFIFYAHKNDALAAFSMILMVIISCVPLSFYLEIKSPQWYAKLANGLIMFGLVALFLYVPFQLHQKYYTYQLTHYGTTVYGEITGHGTTTGKGGKHRHALLRYSFGGKSYLKTTLDDKFKYKNGYQVQLLISVNDPEIFSIIEISQ